MSPDLSEPGSERNADLKLVDRGSDRTSDPGGGAAATVPEKPRRRGVPVWIFALVVIVGLVVVGWQMHAKRALEAEVARVEEELARSTALLEAHRVRLDEIRTGIYDLSAQIDSLRGLADSSLTESDEIGDESGDESGDAGLPGDEGAPLDPIYDFESSPL